MTPALWITLAVGFVGAGGLGVLVGAVLTHRRESKRDKANATMTYANSLQSRLATVEKQVVDLWAERQKDAETIRARDEIIRAKDDHIDVLEAHIWARRDPPPPARPTLA